MKISLPGKEKLIPAAAGCLILLAVSGACASPLPYRQVFSGTRAEIDNPSVIFSDSAGKFAELVPEAPRGHKAPEGELTAAEINRLRNAPLTLDNVVLPTPQGTPQSESEWCFMLLGAGRRSEDVLLAVRELSVSDGTLTVLATEMINDRSSETVGSSPWILCLVKKEDVKEVEKVVVNYSRMNPRASCLNGAASDTWMSYAPRGSRRASGRTAPARYPRG